MDWEEPGPACGGEGSASTELGYWRFWCSGNRALRLVHATMGLSVHGEHYGECSTLCPLVLHASPPWNLWPHPLSFLQVSGASLARPPPVFPVLSPSTSSPVLRNRSSGVVATSLGSRDILVCSARARQTKETQFRDHPSPHPSTEKRESLWDM